MRAVVTTEVSIPAAEAWPKINDQFGDVGDWTSQLTGSYLADDEMGLDATRVCRNRNKVLEEQVTAYEPDKMRFTYTLLDPPSWVKGVTNTWSIAPVGPDACTLSMDVSMDVAWYVRPATPVLAFGFRRLLRRIQQEFAHWAETGEPHPRKRAHSVKNARWRAGDLVSAPGRRPA